MTFLETFEETINFLKEQNLVKNKTQTKDGQLKQQRNYLKKCGFEQFETNENSFVLNIKNEECSDIVLKRVDPYAINMFVSLKKDLSDQYNIFVEETKGKWENTLFDEKYDTFNEVKTSLKNVFHITDKMADKEKLNEEIEYLTISLENQNIRKR